MRQLQAQLKEDIMKITVDRFEGDFAVVELPDGKMVNIPKILIPDANEGDVVSVCVDAAETSKRKERISSLMNDLFK